MPLAAPSGLRLGRIARTRDGVVNDPGLPGSHESVVRMTSNRISTSLPNVGKSLVEASARARAVARRSRLEWHAGVLHKYVHNAPGSTAQTCQCPRSGVPILFGRTTHERPRPVWGSNDAPASSRSVACVGDGDRDRPGQTGAGGVRLR